MLNPTSSSAIFGRTSTFLPGTSTAQRKEITPLQETTNNERVMRRFEEELKKLKGQGNHNESVASSSMNPAQRLPSSFDQLSENERYAKALLITVREEIYKKGYKSSNKLRAAPPGEDKNQWKKKEEERLSKADNEVNRIRTQLPFSSAVPSFLEMQKRKLNAIEAKGHNCGDLVRAGISILEQAGIKDMYIVSLSDLNHEILLIGKIPPAGLPLDMEKWPSYLAICDPWANIACSAAKAFIPAFMEKMQKWESNDKKIIHVDKKVWTNPIYTDFEKKLRGLCEVYAPIGGKEDKDEDGRTPLMVAACTGNVDDVQILLKARADIEATDKEGKTPLLVAAYKGYAKVLSALLEAGANIEAKDKNGVTPLIAAAHNVPSEVMSILLKAGANIEAKDNKGKTAKEYASKLATARDDKEMLALNEAALQKQKWSSGKSVGRFHRVFRRIWG